MQDRLHASIRRLCAHGCAVGWLLAACGGFPGRAYGEADAAASLPLPEWSPDELSTLERQGGPPGLGILLPRDPALFSSMDEAAGFLNPGPRLADVPLPAFPEGRGLVPKDLSLFLPDSVLRGPAGSERSSTQPTPATSLRDLTPEHLEAACRSPTGAYLLDPEGVVPEITTDQIRRFLDFHASDARIDAYLLVMDRDQQLPARAELDRFASGSLATGNSCLVAYPLGEPWRARVFLSKPVFAATTQAYLADMVADCVKDAMLTEDHGEQLHRFAVRLSTRLFWLENASAQAARPRTQAQPLREVTSDSVAAVRGDLPLRELIVIVLLVVGTLASGTLVLRRLKAWHAQREFTQVWMLPDPEVAPRLGGAFCGGTGVSMSYRP